MHEITKSPRIAHEKMCKKYSNMSTTLTMTFHYSIHSKGDVRTVHCQKAKYPRFILDDFVCE